MPAYHGPQMQLEIEIEDVVSEREGYGVIEKKGAEIIERAIERDPRSSSEMPE